MSYRTSADQIFARVDRLRQRAMLLLSTQRGPEAAPSLDDAAEAAAALAARVELRLPRLMALCGLGPLAADVLTCLVAAEFNPFMRTVVRALQRENGRPWIELGTIAELIELGPTGVPELGRLFAPSAALRGWGLVRVDDSGGESPIVATRVKMVPRVAHYLVGDDTLPDGLTLRAPCVLAIDERAQSAVRLLRRALLSGRRMAVEISAGPSAGKKQLAHAIAAALGRPLLLVDLARVAPSELDERLAEIRREAQLANALPCLDHWDALLIAPAPSEEAVASAGPRLPAALATFLREGPPLVLLTAGERRALLEQHTEAALFVEIPLPAPSLRASALERALAGAELSPEIDCTDLARRFALSEGRMARAARAAVEQAAAGEVEPRPVTRTDLIDACRHQLQHDLQSLAVRVTNSHRWEDLVIPVEVYEGLREMIDYMRYAGQVYDDWGFGARHSLSQGISALFAGPPGTGKTMCASVMARELDMELFRVDLSRVVSKWIGETERNLAKVFDEAQRSSAIILFDEADSLFAKRTEVKSSVDRYANLEVNYLLQRMESYSGVTILTSNFEDTIDSAFKRRLTFRLRFEKPDAAARTALWRKMFPERAQLGADVDCARLGSLFEMSGGSIRNAAVRAAFMAAGEGRGIDMAVCLLAAERESREMGLLTRSIAGERHLESPPPPPPVEETRFAMTGPKARLVPITSQDDRVCLGRDLMYTPKTLVAGWSGQF